jgi:hypothetical protein
LSAGDEENSIGCQLLADIREIFQNAGQDKLSSETLCKELEKMEERPWPEFRNGKPLSVNQLARLIRPFGLRPKQARIGGDKTRGYELETFSDAFSRYLPPLQPVHPVQLNTDKGFSRSHDPVQAEKCTGLNIAVSCSQQRLVPGVPVGEGEYSSKADVLSGSDPDKSNEFDRESYEERAAIIEFDGGLTRAEAERLAKHLQ